MSPTFQRSGRFDRDFEALASSNQRRFRLAVNQFVDDLRGGRGFRPGLRVKRIQGTADIWEMTFAPDGRATWQYGAEIRPGEPHVVWRRIGSHDVFRRP